MKRIVVLGAGIGGMSVAYELRAALGKDRAEITVIGEGTKFSFTPSNPWVAVGWRKPADIQIDAPVHLAKKGIGFEAAGAERVLPESNQVLLRDGRTLDYDYLVITTGPRLAFDEVPGLGPSAHTQSICTTDHAVMILDADLRKRKLRDRVPMTYVTSEPYVGHMGLGGVGDSKGLLESELRQRHIKWITNAKITEIGASEVRAQELDDRGQPVKEHALPFKYAMVMPPFTGVDAVRQAKDLCNPRGFVQIDAHQRNPKYPNVYSAGVCVAIPPVEVTPVPTGAPKTGFMIESMVTAIVSNIKADIEGRAVAAKATWNAICLADMGDTGAAFVAIPQIPPRNVTWAKVGRWVHLAKIAFEKYFLAKMRSGNTEPIYEKYVLKALGIERLK